MIYNLERVRGIDAFRYRRGASAGKPSDLCVENFQRDCLGCFCPFERLAGHDAWLAQICDLRLVAAREGIVKSLLG